MDQPPRALSRVVVDPGAPVSHPRPAPGGPRGTDATSGNDADGSDTNMSHPVVVDSLGKPCPMPVIDIAAAVKPAPIGTVFHLLADDGTAKVDVPIWCRMQRQRLDDITEDGAVLTFTITKVRESH